MKLTFPVMGLHEGVGYDIQPPGTTNDAKNVRGYDALKNRLRGGRRSGLSKWLAETVNGGALVQTMCRVGVAQAAAETRTTVTDDFTSSAYGTTGEGNIGINYQRGILGSSGLVLSVASGTSVGTEFDGTNDRLCFVQRTIGSGIIGFPLLAIAYNTTNDITCIIRGTGTATTNNSSAGLADEPTQVGPVIRCGPKFNTGIGARLIRVGADQVQLQIFSFANTTVTSLAVSATQTLNGSSVATADCTIRLYNNASGNPEAILDWPTQAIAALTISTTTALEGTRGGVMGSPVSLNGSITQWRKITSVTYTKIVPASPTTIQILQGTEANTTNGNRYHLPTGWTSKDIEYSAGTVTPTVGFASSASDPSYIAVDDTNDVIWESTSTITPTNTIRMVESTTGRTTKSLEVQAPTPASATASFPGVGWLVGADGKSGLFMSPNASGQATTTPNTGMFQCTGSVRLRIVLNGVSVYTITGLASPINDAGLCHQTHFYRMSFNPANYKITISVNDIPVFTYTLTAEAQGWVDQLPGNRSCFMFRESASIVASSAGVIRYVDTTGNVGATDVELLAVAEGTVKGIEDGAISSITGGAGILSTLPFNPMLQEAFGKVFMVDGATLRYYDKANNIINQWTATSGGTVPALPRLIALYRGRIVLSGLVADPHNWFMAEVGDPFNFDYAPTPVTSIMAVAGNNAQVGLVGDMITALIPFGDDTLLFGGDHTIWQLTGDPAAGGTIDQVSDKTGIAFGKAWARDPDGNLYFWGTAGGIFKMQVGGKPLSMTDGRIDARLKHVDLTANRVFMEWDYLRKALITLIVPADAEADVRIIVWESRNNAFWEDEYPVEIGPHCMLAYDGNDPDDQALLFGCRDGYIRKIDDDADDDDGYEIESYFRYEPLLSQSGNLDVILTSLTPVLAGGSGRVDISVYTGQTAEECMTATSPRIKRVLHLAGRNPSVRQKVRGSALQVKVGHTGSTRWAMESMEAEFAESGMPRKMTTPDAG